MLEDALKLRVDVRRSTFGMQMVDIDILQLPGASPLTKSPHQTLGHIGYRTDVDMVARLDDFDGFSGRNCLILFLHILCKLLFPKVVKYGIGQVFWLVQVGNVFPITNISDSCVANRVQDLQLRA